MAALCQQRWIGRRLVVPVAADKAVGKVEIGDAFAVVDADDFTEFAAS